MVKIGTEAEAYGLFLRELSLISNKMKDTMAQSKELREARDRSLYEKYVSSLESHHFAGREEAAEFARNCPAPRFFISAKTLSNHIGAMMSGMAVCVKSEKRRMIRELYDRYIRFRDSHRDCGYSRERICEILTEQPAPSFYIGLSSACHIIDRERTKAARRFREHYYGKK